MAASRHTGCCCCYCHHDPVTMITQWQTGHHAKYYYHHSHRFHCHYSTWLHISMTVTTYNLSYPVFNSKSLTWFLPATGLHQYQHPPSPRPTLTYLGLLRRHSLCSQPQRHPFQGTALPQLTKHSSKSMQLLSIPQNSSTLTRLGSTLRNWHSYLHSIELVYLNLLQTYLDSLPRHSLCSQYSDIHSTQQLYLDLLTRHSLHSWPSFHKTGLLKPAIT